jgi:hypothetical protein
MNRVISLLVPIGLLIGCTPSDDRLVNLSREANERQARQNGIIAEQSRSLAAERQSLANATSLLIERTGANQKELLSTFDKQSGVLAKERQQLQVESSRLLAQKEQLAVAQIREPLIAQAIMSLGLVLACLAPLALCAWLFAHANRPDELSHALSELLVLDLVSKQPLLAGPVYSHARLGYQEPDQGPSEPACEEEFPF